MEAQSARLVPLDLRSTQFIVRLVALAALGIQLVATLLTAQLAGAVAPAPPHFERTWERVDRPVAELLESRSWLWGPEANTEVLTEPYAESPGGMREVQYYDKSRMEINNPNEGDPNSPWYVTNGLLVVELMTGQMQVGDADFVERLPAEINVAGDADDPDGVTYQTFATLRDLPPLADGETIIQMVDRDGNVTEDPALADYGVTAAHRVTVPGIDHQVASPFWDFMNSSGLIYDPELGNVQGELFPSPFYATGLPLTEAHFVMALIGGVQHVVLAQCFERRCLTFTPENDPGWQVEAGNVGLHYRDWRTDPQYDKPGGPPLPPQDGIPVINEVKFWPDEGDLQWVELFNPSDTAAELSGFEIANGTNDHVTALPEVNLPPDAYLVVYFGSGDNELDFGDLRGSYYDAAAPAEFFDPDSDEVALIAIDVGVDTIVDFFAWSYEDVYQPLNLYNDAVAAGQWSQDDYFDASRRNGLDLVHPVGQGETVGRDGLSTDTNSSADWAELGGVDALGETPQFQNAHELDLDPSPPPPPPPPGGGGGPAEWTVMVFVDGRSNLYRAFLNEVNKMERAGSNEDVNIVVQFAWRNGAGDSTAAVRWHLEQDSDMSRISSPAFGLGPAEASNPGDPQALSDFITWAKTSYPANKYAIVLAGHGQGWKGTMFNGEDSDYLKMSELSTGLSALGQKFEVVDFESCLMGQTEVGYQIEPAAKMMVASEEVMWTVIPWDRFFNELKANTGWNAGQYADRKAEINAEGHRAGRSRSIRNLYTSASIDLTGLTGTLAPAISAFATTLIDDVDDVNQHDLVSDNSQMTIKHAALEQAEYFTDTNFKDIYHFADLISKQPLKAAAPAGPVKIALAEGGPVVRWEDHGSAQPNANGLSIYFPHDLLLPDGNVTARYPQTPVGFLTVDSFDDPKYDPAVNPNTHLYKLDAAILLPRLAGEPHAMADDPNFEFPNDTTWDEFLHRYYKPVADACIISGDDCIKEITVEVGTNVPLSGRGSSDSDGPEDATLGDWLNGGPGGNDVPAHTTTAVEHYYWDFNTSVDNPAPKPNYVEGQRYEVCDIEDCDRDDIDELDDDRDAVGKTPIFPCVTPGTFGIRLMVWDEHHDHARQRNEDRDHNEGRHWLHFNVHSDTVMVHCIESDTPKQPLKRSNKEQVVPGEGFEYEIIVPANPELVGSATASITDNLPEWVEFVGIAECNHGNCGYNEELHRVTMQNATINPGEELILRFAVKVIQEPETEFPPEILNCATVGDGVFLTEVCATTTLVVESTPPEEPAKSANKEQVSPGESLQYEISVPANPELVGLSDAGIADNLPEWVNFSSIVECNAGECGYDEVLHMVYMQGATLSPGEKLILRFNVVVIDAAETEFPTEITNCADANDGVASHELCVSTTLILDSGPPSTGMRASSIDR